MRSVRPVGLHDATNRNPLPRTVSMPGTAALELCSQTGDVHIDRVRVNRISSFVPHLDGNGPATDDRGRTPKKKLDDRTFGGR